MNKITVLVAILIALAPTLPAFSENSSRILAQIRGQDSQEFFNEGDQQMEQETQTLENEQSQESTEEREEQNLQAPTQEPTEQQEEQNLERTLNIEQKNPQTPEVQDIPAPGVGDNVPTPPPTGEVEIKLPE